MAKETDRLVKQLSISENEKDVENAYRTALERRFPGSTTSRWNTDGTLICEKLTVLLEFKYDYSLTEPLQQAAVILQAIFYLKQMEHDGQPLPKAIFIGDINECFCVATAVVACYLGRELDWTVPPSSAAKSYPELVVEIAQDQEIESFVYSVDKRFDLPAVIEKLQKINQGEPYSVKIAPNNIVGVFQTFQKYVVTDKHFKKVKQDVRQKRASEFVNAFYTCITSPDDAFLHPNKEDVLMVHGQEIKVVAGRYRTFFQQFSRQYTERELEALTACKDRILDEIFRRWTGAFFTPDIWAEEAHRLITEQLGEDWKNEWVVWDCAAGTGQLTRNHRFGELYISTVDAQDIQTITDCGYNPEATSFQYDFLHDDHPTDLGAKIPPGLQEAFQSRKKVCFFINPPFATSSSLGKEGESKKGVEVTRTYITMKERGLGDAVRQLYAQFIWRMIALSRRYENEVAICIFSKPVFLTGEKFQRFRQLLFNDFCLGGGFLFDAAHFADVESWPVLFSVWKPGQESRSKFSVRVKDIDDKTLEIQPIQTKTLYNTDTSERLKTWARKDSRYDQRPQDAPQLSSAITVKQTGYGRLVPGALGYICVKENSPQANAERVLLFTSTYSSSDGHGYSICDSNFRKAMATFAARKTIKCDWLNDKDEYLAPNVAHPDYEQWNNDAIVYALFHYSSQQSSLRQIEYKGKKWDILNQFFFLSLDEMRTLADQCRFGAMFHDTDAFPGERYVFQRLQEVSLTDDANEVLEAARQLVRQSMAIRPTWHQSHPEHHLHAWDAGWAQLKPLFQEHFADDYASFRKLYQLLENRLREGVYKFEFLRRDN